MQESLFEEHFTQAKFGGTPVVIKLRAANGLKISYISNALLEFEVGGITWTRRGNS